MSEKRMSPLLELVKTRLREFARETGAVFWVFGFPILMAICLGLAFRNRPPDLPAVAVLESTPSPWSEPLASDQLDAKRLEPEEAERGLARARYDLIVELSGSADPKYTFDPTQERSKLARVMVSDVLQRAAGRKDLLEIAEAPSQRQGTRYIDFLLPGLIGMNLMGSSMWGVGYNLVVARKRRLLRRYAVTPMRRSHFLLSYFASRSVFLVLELGVLLTFGALVFGTQIQGNPVSFVGLSILGAASFAAISLIIGARVENTDVANGWMNFVQLPMWVLSGTFFSYERFPEWMHEPIRWLPLTALVDALRDVFNNAVPLAELWHPVLVLGVWSAGGFLVALRYFRWQ
jgi:ABC-type multidrug transport system permease subunit